MALYILARRLEPNRDEVKARVALERGADAADIPELVSRECLKIRDSEKVAALINTAVNFAMSADFPITDDLVTQLRDAASWVKNAAKGYDPTRGPIERDFGRYGCRLA